MGQRVNHLMLGMEEGVILLGDLHSNLQDVDTTPSWRFADEFHHSHFWPCRHSEMPPPMSNMSTCRSGGDHSGSVGCTTRTSPSSGYRGEEEPGMVHDHGRVVGCTAA